MFRLFINYRLSPAVNLFRMISDSKLIYTVDLLKEKATGYLDANDSAQACEKSFQACKLAMMNYVKKLESTSNIKIVPETLNNPWNYKMFSKLCFLIRKKVDPYLAENIGFGWSKAYEFHVKGWTQNDLSVEEVKFDLPYVFRFLDIVNNKLKVDIEMGSYIKERLFNLDLDKLAEEINKESEVKKVDLIFEKSKIRKDLRKELNAIYLKKYGENIPDVLVKNKDAIDQHFA